MGLDEFLRRRFPWGPADGARSLVLATACGIGLIVVWYQVAGRGVFGDQIGWMTAGAVILLVALYALASLIVRGRRAVGERLALMIPDPVGHLGARSQPAAQLRKQAGPDGSEVAVVDGRDLYHRPDCPMLQGRNHVMLSATSALAQGIQPCALCDEVAS